MWDQFIFAINRIREKLWIKPLVVSLVSVGGAFVVKGIDLSTFSYDIPRIAPETNQVLLSIMASSMLLIATFAVASMVSAYASASNTGTPRAFPVVVADDQSQLALSSFIGAFIYSIVALIAVTNGFYEKNGHFATFVLTLAVFAWVVIMFVRWVDTIARLGRLGTIIDRLEATTATALTKRGHRPTLRGAENSSDNTGLAIYSAAIGYVQRVDIASLQACAKRYECTISVAILPGGFAVPDRPLAYVSAGKSRLEEEDTSRIANAFTIGADRVYDEDPRFGLIVLSEVASRALSPAVNDAGTAIKIIGTFVRLFSIWDRASKVDCDEDEFDRVEVPLLSSKDMFEDAFLAIARDGAGLLEVQLRLQKALATLAAMDNAEFKDAARLLSQRAMDNAENALILEQDIDCLREVASHVEGQ